MVPESVQLRFKTAGDPLSALRERTQLFDGTSAPDVTPSYVMRTQQLLCNTDQVLDAVKVTLEHEYSFMPLISGGIKLALKFGLKRPVYFEPITRFIQMTVDHLIFLGRYTLREFFTSTQAQQLFLRAYKYLWEMSLEIGNVFMNDFNQENLLSAVVQSRKFWRPVDHLFTATRMCIERDISSIINSMKVMLPDSDVFALERDNLERLERQRRMDELAEERRIEKRLSVIKWVSDLDYSSIQEDILSHRFGDTGTWLLQHGRFKDWFEGKGSSFLWCWGNPGVGKTVLASIVQDHITTSFRNNLDVGSAFVYCTYREPRQPSLYIRSYIRQLLLRLPSLPEGTEV
jgi:hypothetical protein